MHRILLATLLILITSACCTTEYVYVKSDVLIPDHQTLEPLSVAQNSGIDPIVRDILQRNKAKLIANIKQLELNIETHNKDNSEIPVPDT